MTAWAQNVQLLREAASRGGHMAHAAGTSPPPPTAPLGASGAETIKEFEVQLLLPFDIPTTRKCNRQQIPCIFHLQC